jgi:hypothetical protein
MLEFVKDIFVPRGMLLAKANHNNQPPTVNCILKSCHGNTGDPETSSG